MMMRAPPFLTLVTKNRFRNRVVEGKLRESWLNSGDNLFITRDNSVVWSCIRCRTYSFSAYLDSVNF